MADGKAVSSDEKPAATDGKAGLIGAIKGPYGLLGVVAVVLEGSLGVWFLQAGTGAERITAGILMTIILLAIIGAVLIIDRRQVTTQAGLQRAQKLDSAPVSPDDVKTIPVAAPDSPDNAAQLPGEIIAAPDGAYIIARPPQGWSIRQATMGSVIQEKLGIQNIDGLPEWPGGSVLEFLYGDAPIFMPRPGQTRCNGRLYPLLLSEPFGRKLQITTVPHRQPPFFIERSLYDNFVGMVVNNVQLQLTSITALALGTLPKSNRATLAAEQRQVLENILLDDRAVTSVEIDVKFNAIRGDLLDYFFVASNFREAGTGTEAADQVDRDVERLFNSFRPTSVVDLTAAQKAAAARADADFAAAAPAINTMMFDNQFAVVQARLRELDYHTPEGLARAMANLRPFRKLAASLPDRQTYLGPLWQAMDQAEHGDTTAFKQILDTELHPPP
jgi:hypothetical protein